MNAKNKKGDEQLLNKLLKEPVAHFTIAHSFYTASTKATAKWTPVYSIYFGKPQAAQLMAALQILVAK